MATRILVRADDELQNFIAGAPNNATLVVEGPRPGTTTISRDNITLENGGNAVFEKIRLAGTRKKVHLEKLVFNRTTPVTSNFNFAVEVETGISCTFLDLDVSGHGYNEGIRFRNYGESVGCLVKNCHFYELENKAVVVHGNYMRVEGCHIHDLYRTHEVPIFQDVDAFNVNGNNNTFRGNYCHDMDLFRSLSTKNTGLTGPPHCDFVQTSQAFKADGVTSWTTNDLLVTENVCHDLVGQAIILQSNTTPDAQIYDPVITHNTFLVQNWNNVQMMGTVRAVITHNVLGLGRYTGTYADAGHASPVENGQYLGGRFTWFQPATNGGNADNIDPEVAHNLMVGGNTAFIYEDIKQPEGTTHSTNLHLHSNTRIDGDITEADIPYSEIGEGRGPTVQGSHH